MSLIICAGGNEEFSFAKGVGIGLINAACGLAQLCLEYLKAGKDIENIIFIGTCGLYNEPKDTSKNLKQGLKDEKNLKPANELLQIYESAHCFNVEYAKLCANFYTPLSNEINANVSQETFKCNSSNYICADKTAAQKFANLGLNLENMELFAVLSVAKRFKIPATSYLCATNFCDENAHKNFVKNHKEAKIKLEEFLQGKNLI